MKNPREYLVVPTQFGSAQNPRWVKTPTSEASLLASAKLQHDCALEIRRSAKAKFGSVKRYCDVANLSYQRTGQVLRGDRMMRLDDIGSAVAHLGLSVRFASKYAEVSDGVHAVVAGNSSMRDAMGAFYTPDSIAEYMIGRLGLMDGARVLEPSFGDGAFLSALRRNDASRLDVIGVEIDDVASKLAVDVGLLDEDHLVRSDFFDVPALGDFNAVVGNPPYVRLRAVDAAEKAKALSVSASHNGIDFGEEASLWIPFLIKSVDHLCRGGALAFVLPYEVTYVKYARCLWPYIGKRFSSISVVRVHERVFPDLMQDVVLFFCKGYGGSCDKANYQCFETTGDLATGNAVVDSLVEIDAVANGERAFLHAMVDAAILDTIRDNPDLVSRCLDETAFHIGYVCGNKGFFHPAPQTISEFKLPSTSLVQTAMSSRRLSGFPLRTSDRMSKDVLWLPTGTLTAEEETYVSQGEQDGVQNGYKCRIRKPWWRVPMVKRPDVLLSVFSDSPRLMLNDAEWVFSNSIMGAEMRNNVSVESFVETWYTVLTLLSFELEVHSLGGGVLVAVPNEANHVAKVSFNKASGDPKVLESISEALESGDVDKAYHVGDELLGDLFGPEFVDAAWATVELLRAWRKGR